MKLSKNNFLSIVIICFILISGYFFMRNMNHFGLKCIISSVDGEKYCIRERKNLHKAAALLASISKKCQKIVDIMYKKHPKNEFVEQMKERFNPEKFQETLPTSTYTAYSENKGKKMAFCLNKHKDNNEQLIDENTLMFVALHEITHIGTRDVGHTKQYWKNFKFVLENASESGLYTPVDYKNNPEPYCGMDITDNPLFDLK